PGGIHLFHNLIFFLLERFFFGARLQRSFPLAGRKQTSGKQRNCDVDAGCGVVALYGRRTYGRPSNTAERINPGESRVLLCNSLSFECLDAIAQRNYLRSDISSRRNQGAYVLARKWKLRLVTQCKAVKFTKSHRIGKLCVRHPEGIFRLED